MKIITCVALAAAMALFGFAEPEPTFKKIRRNPEYQNALAKGAMAQISLKVVDDERLPVRRASVHARYDMTTYANESSYLTDERGLCCFTDKTRYCVELDISKDGYYDSRVRMPLTGFEHAHDVRDGKWQPYPMEKTVILKKIRNPTALCTICNLFRFPATNIWFRFDMRVGDFVKPLGKGETADFECLVEWDGLPPTKSTCCKMSLRMLDRLSGGYYADCTKESEYPFSYAAKVDAELIKELNVVNRDGNPHTTKVPFREGCEFVTRTRCKVDNDGRLVAANYGSIRALSVSPSWDGNPTLRLYSVINPTPNDTNLEDDELYQRYKRLRDR